MTVGKVRIAISCIDHAVRTAEMAGSPTPALAAADFSSSSLAGTGRPTNPSVGQLDMLEARRGDLGECRHHSAESAS